MLIWLVSDLIESEEVLLGANYMFAPKNIYKAQLQKSWNIQLSR